MSAVPPSDLATQLHEAKAQIERMNRDGNALLQRNAELEAAAKRTVLAPRPSSHETKPKPPSAPEFSGLHLKGYEVDAWLREMKKQFDHYGSPTFPDDEAKVRHAALFLKGPALEWWDTKDKSGGIDTDWDLFVGALRERYRPMQIATMARERLGALRQKGGVSSYCDVFLKELTPITDMGPADQIFNFVKGLSSVAMQSKIREKDPKTLHAAMDIAIHADAFQGKGVAGAYGYRSYGSGHQSSSGAAPMDVNVIDSGEVAYESGLGAGDATPGLSVAALVAQAVKEALAEQQKSFLAAIGQKAGAGSSGYKGSEKIQGLQPGDIDQLRREGRCFRCKKEGHMKNECPNRPKSKN